MPSVQTPDDTRKQKASIVYRQQHRQIVPFGNCNTQHKYSDPSPPTPLYHRRRHRSVEAFTLVVVVVYATAVLASTAGIIASWLFHCPKIRKHRIRSMSKSHHASTFFREGPCALEQPSGWYGDLEPLGCGSSRRMHTDHRQPYRDGISITRQKITR